MSAPIQLLKEAAEEGVKLKSFVKSETKAAINAKKISEEAAESVSKRTAEAEGRRITAAVRPEDTKNVLRNRTEELRAQAKAEKEAAKVAKQNQAFANAEAADNEILTASLPTKEEEAAAYQAAKQAELNKAIANDADMLREDNVVHVTNTEKPQPTLNTNRNNTTVAGIANRDAYNQAVSDTRQMLSQGTITRSEAKQRFTKARAARDKQIKLENLQKEVNEFNYEDPKYNDLFKKQGIDTGTPWSSTARAALGTAVVGAGVCAALSSSRGQQSNAQLYGQQPLY